MKKLLKELLCWFKKLFGKCEEKKCCDEKAEVKEEKKPQPKPEKKPKPEKPKKEYKAPDHLRKAHDGTPAKFIDEKGYYADPHDSDFAKAKIQTFLWKPKADHQNTPVVVVTCDALRSYDLKMEVVSAKGRVLKRKIRNNGRANPRHEHRFARIHFYIDDRSASQLKKSAPLVVRFYHEANGKKTVISEHKVKDPTKRIDKF